MCATKKRRTISPGVVYNQVTIKPALLVASSCSFFRTIMMFDYTRTRDLSDCEERRFRVLGAHQVFRTPRECLDT